MILTTPLIERLAEEGPVHVVATPANAGILANHPAVTSVILFDKRRADSGIGGMRRIARAIRATGATRAFLAQGSVRTAAVAWLAGVPHRIGFATSPGRVLYTRRVALDRSLHHAQRLWQLGSTPRASRDVGTETIPALRPSLFPSATDESHVRALLQEYDVGDREPLIALAPGSVWATKRWPSYDALAAQLVEAYGSTARIVVLGGSDDRELATSISSAVEAAHGPRVVNAAGRLSLLASAALLRRARVMVTNDSAPLHLASAMNTPTIAMFGPTIPAFGFGPLAERRRVVEEFSLACRPCDAHGPQRCPLGHWQCMRNISAERVVPLVREFVPSR